MFKCLFYIRVSLDSKNCSRELSVVDVGSSLDFGGFFLWNPVGGSSLDSGGFFLWNPGGFKVPLYLYFPPSCC